MQKHKPSFNTAIAFIALCVLLTINGCKKNDAVSDCSNGVKDANENMVDCGGDCNACNIPYIKTINSNNSYVNTYFYDTQHRLDSVYQLGSNYSVGVKYSYQPGVVIETVTNNAGPSVLSAHYYLNSNGYVHTSVYFRPAGSSNDTLTYIYDTEGHLIYESEIDSRHTWQNGNEVSSGDVTYTYATDKLNTIANQNTGVYYLGKSSVNLIQTDLYAAAPPTVNYTYTYDAQNRVITKKKTLGSASNITTYTYY